MDNPTYANLLDIYYYDKKFDKYVILGKDRPLPLSAILNSGNGHFLIKNNTKFYITNIEIKYEEPSNYNIAMNIASQGQIPNTNTRVINRSISKADFPELHLLPPSGVIKIFLEVYPKPGYKIDFYNLPLDISFRRSVISTENMLIHFEFSEDGHDARIYDSFNDIVGIVHDADPSTNKIINNFGLAAFRNKGDKIDFSLSSFDIVVSPISKEVTGKINAGCSISTFVVVDMRALLPSPLRIGPKIANTFNSAVVLKAKVTTGVNINPNFYILGQNVSNIKTHVDFMRNLQYTGTTKTSVYVTNTHDMLMNIAKVKTSLFVAAVGQTDTSTITVKTAVKVGSIEPNVLSLRNNVIYAVHVAYIPIYTVLAAAAIRTGVSLNSIISYSLIGKAVKVGVATAPIISYNATNSNLSTIRAGVNIQTI
jgi:hypothetical protein